ncbi:MAG: T9SS type A sorting domain-containing protein [Bacteroidia bacterium]
MPSIFVLAFGIANGQTSCNPTTAPLQVYYPNTVNSPTVNSVNEYLCGPNTIVYDTLEQGCHFVYVNALSTLFLKPTISCAAQSEVWVKSNSTLNVVPGSAGLLQIYFESGAIINNPFAVTIYSTMCTSISFPTVNCTSTGLTEKTSQNNSFDVYPNPAEDNLSIKIFGNTVNQAQIINTIGQVLKETEIINPINDIDIKDLPNGVYILSLKGQNSSVNSKYFIISR